MLDSKAILLVVRLDGLGGRAGVVELQRLTKQGAECYRSSLLKCLDGGLVTLYLASSGLQLHKAAFDKQLTTPQNLYLELHSYNKQLHKAVSSVVSQAVDRRNFSAQYQAVVSGKKARKDPLQQAILKLNPMDRGDAWRQVMALDNDQQANLRARFSP